jgi:TRAP-type C4-dicarboxylate transport system permease small subunit
VDRTDSAVGFVSRVSLVVGSVLMLGAMIWITADVVTRQTGLAAIRGTHEVVSNILVVLTFLFLPYVVRTRRHIRSTILVLRLPARWQERMGQASYLIGAVLFLLLAYASWEPAVRAWRIGEAQGHGGLVVPTAPVRFLIVGTSVLVAIECLLMLRRPLEAAAELEIVEEAGEEVPRA